MMLPAPLWTAVLKTPDAFVVVDTSPEGNVAGGVAPTISVGPTTTVAFAITALES
jgi:hypothetical protein